MGKSISDTLRAEVLMDALPYIQKYNGKIVVVKYGGNAMTSDVLKDSVMADLVLLSLIGVKVVLVHGGVTIRSLVSQGCRPIGEHFVITKAERNVIQELGGVPAYQRLIEVYATLATHEQAMLRRGLHVGRVVSEYQDKFEQGDFLVRNVMGVDQESGAIVLGDYVRPGQTVQFHVRDADTADGELKQMLAAIKNTPGANPQAALLFTCNGRGTRLFPGPNHDAETIGEALGNVPLAGFFAAGEMGPVGGKNFLHGFTASMALFEPR